MKNVLLAAGIVGLCVAVTAAARQAHTVQDKIELKQTGEPAGKPNPPCGDPKGDFTAKDVVANATPAAIGAYVGNAIASTIASKVPPGNRQWFADRIGVPHNGPSTCATLCVVYPKTSKANVTACMTETGGNGRDCATAPKDYNGGDDHQFGRFDRFTTETIDDNVVACVTGKNWSHNRNRWFTVTTTY